MCRCSRTRRSIRQRDERAEELAQILLHTTRDLTVILQYDDTPLIEVVRTEQAGFTTRFNVYHEDGTFLAKVVGARIFASDAGEKVGLVLRHPKDKTVCELGGRTVFELNRTGPAAFSAQAELATPDGAFIKCRSDEMVQLLRSNQPLQLGGMILTNNYFEGLRIGIHLQADGSLNIGVS